MKKLSQINESIWSDIHKRSNGSEIRKEDGRKVHTCIGIDVTLKNPECDYDTLIRDLIELNSEYHSEYGVGVVNQRDINLTPDEMINVRKWEAPYCYLIYDGNHGTSLFANFWSYDEIIDFELDNDFGENYLEDDYIAICKCVATKLKEVGDCLSLIPRRNSSVYKRKDNPYEGEFALKLIDEADVYNWAIERSDDYYWFEDYVEYMIDTFPELKDTDFITWTYYDGANIAIPYTSISNLMNYNKYREFTKTYFTNEETE